MKKISGINWPYVMMAMLLAIMVLSGCIALKTIENLFASHPWNHVKNMTMRYGEHDSPIGMERWFLVLHHEFPATSEDVERDIKYRIHYVTFKPEFQKQHKFPANTVLDILRLENIHMSNKSSILDGFRSIDFGMDGKLEKAFATGPYGVWTSVSLKVGTEFAYGRYYEEIKRFVRNDWFGNFREYPKKR